jgi:putative transposase
MIDPVFHNARKLRRPFNAPGHAHELTFTCYHRYPLLARDRTRQWLIDSIRAARETCGFDLWAYVIMPEHAHILLMPRSEQYDIARILKSIKQPVARKAMNYLRANAPHWMERLRVVETNGQVEHHFWQTGGGYDRNIVKGATAWAAVDYLHLNPVRRGLVATPTEWIWSSARCYAGMDGVVLPADDRPPDVGL